MAAPKIQPRTAPRSVTILGSTGSVGCNTLDLIRRAPDRFSLVALTAHENVALLAKQARQFRPEIAVIGNDDKFDALVDELEGTGIKAAAGRQALVEAASRPSDLVMGAIVGAAGLQPTLEAVRRGATVALANKECLVCAGDLMMREVEKHGATLLPVDSEHNAIFQVFEFDRADAIRRIILTASGGPFRASPLEKLAAVTPEQAVAHPNGDMGAKISVDSATMMNKGLELIEAYHLFPVTAEQIEIVIHAQSVIHSMVEYVDGSVLAQLGSPDMRTPIAYTLAWPDRMATPAQQLNFAEIGSLTFEDVDKARFPAPFMAREALQSGGAAPTILNAANEVAVCGFLDRKIGFLDIAGVVGETLERYTHSRIDTLDDVYATDAAARRLAQEIVATLV